MSFSTERPVRGQGNCVSVRRRPLAKVTIYSVKGLVLKGARLFYRGNAIALHLQGRGRGVYIIRGILSFPTNRGIFSILHRDEQRASFFARRFPSYRGMTNYRQVTRRSVGLIGMTPDHHALIRILVRHLQGGLVYSIRYGLSGIFTRIFRGSTRRATIHLSVNEVIGRVRKTYTVGLWNDYRTPNFKLQLTWRLFMRVLWRQYFYDFRSRHLFPMRRARATIGSHLFGKLRTFLTTSRRLT